jgi:hypothetical protein
VRKDKFSELLDRIQSDEKSVRESGQQEYARGEDAFGNFNRIAESISLDRKIILSIYAAKHWDGILSWLDGNKSQREDIRGRIKDLRMYLALLWGMIEEEEINARVDLSYNNYLSHSWKSAISDFETGERTGYCENCGCEDNGSPREFDWLDYPSCERTDP